MTKNSIDNHNGLVYTSIVRQPITCRHCGTEAPPNRGAGHIDVCQGCLGLEDEVPRLMAGQAQTECGTDWEMVVGRGAQIRPGAFLHLKDDMSRVRGCGRWSS
jgi:hypothetical protein